MATNGPELIESDGISYLIYDFADPDAGCRVLTKSKRLFIGNKFEPTVVIDGSFEGNSFGKEHLDDVAGSQWKIWTEINPLLTEYDSDKLVLVYGDANLEENYINWCKVNKQKRVFKKFVYRPQTLLQRSLLYHLGKRGKYIGGPTENPIPNKKWKSKHFICMNAVSKLHRLEMMNLIFEHGWQHKGYLSWLSRRGSNEYVDGITQSKFFQGQLQILDYDGVEINIFNKQLELPSDYRDACFDIVNESTVSNSALFITEKTWKPILQKTPFIIFGSKNSHKHLEEHFGIKPYTDLFDYSFDSLDYPERLDRLKEDNLKRLLNMDINELNEIVNSDKMQELLEYNKKQLLTHFIDEPKDIRLVGLSETEIATAHTRYDTSGNIALPRITY